MSEKVFLSYASGDREIVQRLKSELGSILSRKVQPSQIFDLQFDSVAKGDMRKAIREAMSAAGTVVIVSSPKSDRSEWVNYEAGLADALGKKVVFVGSKGAKKSTLFDRFQGAAQFIEIGDQGLASE